MLALSMGYFVFRPLLGLYLALSSTAVSAGCPTHFDYVVLASIADSGKLLNLSAYRFQRHTSRCVTVQRGGVAAQGGGVAGMSASEADRRSSQIT